MRSEIKNGSGWIGSYPKDICAPIIYVIADADSAHNLIDFCREEPYALIVLTDSDWNRDLSPWPAPKVFRNGSDFSGDAQSYLDRILERIPEIETGRAPLWRGIAGYSLAGLFSIWTLFACDCFQRASSASGSVWFDGFTEYAETHIPLCMPQKVCFSLGDRESATKNLRMAKVADSTQEMLKYFQRLGVQTEFRSEPGGHFNEPDRRLLRAIQAMNR